MRVLFLFLVLVNLAFWWYRGNSDVTVEIVPKVDRAPTGTGVSILQAYGSTEGMGDRGAYDMRSMETNLGGGETAARSDAQSGGITDTVKTGMQNVCYSLGPFSNKDALKKVQMHLSEKARSVSVRVINQKEVQAYWVYLPSYGNYQEAQSVAGELKGKGYTDFFIVAGNAYANAISLGLFKEQSGAERRLMRVRKLGFPAKIDTQYKEIPLYWLDYSQVRGQAISPALWSGIKGGTGHLQRIQRDCNARAGKLS